MASENLIPLLSAALEGKQGLLAAYLFGSRATGEERSRSDADVAVLFDEPLSFDALLRLETELEKAAGLAVDLLDLRRASAFLALDVLRGERFLSPDPVAADEYELYVLRRAGDLEYFERERRNVLLGAETR